MLSFQVWLTVEIYKSSLALKCIYYIERRVANVKGENCHASWATIKDYIGWLSFLFVQIQFFLRSLALRLLGLHSATRLLMLSATATTKWENALEGLLIFGRQGHPPVSWPLLLTPGL